MAPRALKQPRSTVLSYPSLRSERREGENLGTRLVLKGTCIPTGGYLRFRGEWVKPKPHLLPEQIQFIEVRVQFKANLFFFLVHISRTIVRAFDRIPVVSTRQFTAIVTAAVHNVRTDRFSCQLRPAARTFQALRIPGYS